MKNITFSKFADLQPCRRTASLSFPCSPHVLTQAPTPDSPMEGTHCPMFSTPTRNPATFGGLKQLYSQYLLRCIMYYLKKNPFMIPFYRWGATASRLEPLQGDSLLFATKFTEIPGTHFIDLERMKG